MREDSDAGGNKMARPKKRTVDYFPHQCKHGKTMFILEQKYGNDGYAFWFKLLELLGSAEGHYLQLENPADWEFLQAKTRLDDGFCREILDLLARLEAIDQELWESHGVVWSQNFVNGVAPVYKNRGVEIPSKPSFYARKPSDGGVSTPENPQSRVEESRVEESTSPVNQSTPGNSKSTTKDPSTPQLMMNDFVNVIGDTNPTHYQIIASFIGDGMSVELVKEALQKARGRRIPWSYAKSILSSWLKQGIKTVDDLKKSEESDRASPIITAEAIAESRKALDDEIMEVVKREHAAAEAKYQERIAQFRLRKSGAGSRASPS